MLKLSNKPLIIFLGVLLVSISGCDITGTARGTYKQECLDSVIYYENTKRPAPAFNRDGTLKLCYEKIH